MATTLKAGLILQPSERVRVVSGSSGRGSHGTAPDEEGVRNHYLFLKAPYLDKPNSVVRLMMRQHEVCKATWPGRERALTFISLSTTSTTSIPRSTGSTSAWEPMCPTRKTSPFSGL